MKLLIDSKHADALRKAVILSEYQVQLHEADETNVIHAYVTNNGHPLTENQAFWLGTLFEIERIIEGTAIDTAIHS